jgi:hypothetical protein
MTERGESPPAGGRDKCGEGQGHKVKGPSKKGGGYARSTHMKGDVGGAGNHKGYGSGVVHGEYHKSGEKKEHGSSLRLRGEAGIPFRQGIEPGDHFEAEIKEHFPSKGGFAGNKTTEMPHKNFETTDAKGHGKPSGKAEHHVGEQGEFGDAKKDPIQAHAFTRHPQGSMSHSFGHDHEQKMGHLRLSGHRDAHRIGARGKNK